MIHRMCTLSVQTQKLYLLPFAELHNLAHL
jgi:hypothetical protein